MTDIEISKTKKLSEWCKNCESTANCTYKEFRKFLSNTSTPEPPCYSPPRIYPIHAPCGNEFNIAVDDEDLMKESINNEDRLLCLDCKQIITPDSILCSRCHSPVEFDDWHNGYHQGVDIKCLKHDEELLFSIEGFDLMWYLGVRPANVQRK